MVSDQLRHPTDRKFRFGVVVRTAPTGEEWARKARWVESLGFDVLHVPDHIIGPRLAPFSAMTAAALSTSRLRVGTMVISNDFRHPAMLAKEAASIDVLSDGRLELGIGTGWLRNDYQQAGLPYDPPKARIDRLAEALQVLLGLWSDEPFTFLGEHYTIDGLNLLPKPVQRPCPPIMLGGGGPRFLRLAGRVADIVNVANKTSADGAFVEPSDLGSRPFLAKIELLRAAAGARWPGLELGTSISAVAVGGSLNDAVERSAFLAQHVDLIAETPAVLVGSAQTIVDQLRYWRDEHSLSYFVLHDEADVDQFAPIVAELAGN